MAKGQSLQDPFLNALRKERIPVSIYLVNGIKLQGQIDSFDQFVVLLRNSVSQMVYKHAISTVVPARNVRLPAAKTTCRRWRTPRPADRLRSGHGLHCSNGRRSGERAILVCVGLGRAPDPDRVEEFAALARSAGAQVLERARRRRASRPIPRFLIGTGKVEELRERVAALGADLVADRPPLSPSQERNLEKELQVPRARPQRPDPRHLRAARAQPSKASCRSSWRSCSTCRRAWCAAGPTSSASAAAASACAVRAKPSSRPTAA